MNQTAPAKIFWENIPDPIQVKLLNNFWCGSSCKNLTGVAVDSMSIEKGDLIIRGKCIKCGAEIARLIEGDKELKKRSVKIRPSKVDDSSNPDISKLVNFRAGTKQDLQLKEVTKLKIKLFREWNPDEELFQDEEEQGCLPHPFDKILAAGIRPAWEMENILPGLCAPRELVF